MRILLGRLRRDLMLLASELDNNEGQSLEDIGEAAVKQGRAAEAFIIKVDGYYSEADHNWVGVDLGVDHGKQVTLPPLNPGPDEQEVADDPKATPGESIRGNIEAERQAQIASGDLVNTGKADTDRANRDGKENPLDGAEPGEQVKPADKPAPAKK